MWPWASNNQPAPNGYGADRTMHDAIDSGTEAAAGRQRAGTREIPRPGYDPGSRSPGCRPFTCSFSGPAQEVIRAGVLWLTVSRLLDHTRFLECGIYRAVTR